MDLDWTAEDLAFAEEARAFFEKELTPELRDAGRLMTSVYGDHDLGMEWQAKLHAKGWAAPNWQPEHGGQDWTDAQHYLFDRERVLAGAPPTSPMGIHMVAYVIQAFGTPAQKEFFLPRILTGEIFFCQGYSEPQSGSDLASLQMRADSDGDDFILNGSKIWTTHAQQANWMFCLVRTTRGLRPQQGITFLLLDMTAPGVVVRPLVMTSGETVQNQIFFTDVRVPKANVVGAIDDGWTVAKYLLEFERGARGYAAGLKVRAEALREQARTAPTPSGTLLDDEVFASRLARLMMKLDVLEVLEFKLLSAANDDGSVGALSSMMKVLGTELATEMTELAYRAAGTTGTIYQPHGTRPGGAVPGHVPPADGSIVGDVWQALAPLRYFNERAGPIYAGSNEIQRNILAKRVLGL
ncbi:acyl-CoA dehydrogenase family protein [Novosphingobium sp. KCTC 2891]|uniref:acyl-CoA dehydrogenase family protein n=1 Tax=Novosphingobium sp. KCTC 2891 TaxID=2989730 RepID=UPI002223DA56|nr:acyl-CoA dehydrogenase family protein [Novosphingobium sp. KCTC 2891]